MLNIEYSLHIKIENLKIIFISKATKKNLILINVFHLFDSIVMYLSFCFIIFCLIFITLLLINYQHILNNEKYYFQTYQRI